MKKLLILGAGIYQVPLIEKAREMGLYTIAASYSGNYPGLALADEVWNVDTRDFETLIQLSRSAGIAGVCTSGTDVAIISLGAICESLGLSGLSLDCAKTVTDKASMKEAFQTAGTSTPRFYKVSSLAEALKAFEHLGSPVIVKAVDSSGSRGITKAETLQEVETAWKSAMNVTQKDYVLVEEFITAHEIGVDGFIYKGQIQFMLPHDKFTLTTNGTTLPEGHHFPFHCSETLYSEILHQMNLVVQATGMDNCAVNADILVSGSKAWVLEAGGRAGATCIPELISCYCGFDYYQQMILQALGETPDFSFTRELPCMAKLLFCKHQGVITGIDEETLLNLGTSGLRISLDYPVGTQVEAVQNGTSRIGQVIMETDDVAKLDKAMDQVRSAIWIDGVSLETLWNE